MKTQIYTYDADLLPNLSKHKLGSCNMILFDIRSITFKFGKIFKK